MLVSSSNIADLIRTTHAHPPLQKGGGFMAVIDSGEAFGDEELA
jgi:hypothetical protein